MIGKSVSNAVLDGWSGAFYQWEGDVKVCGALQRAELGWLGGRVGGWLGGAVGG
jgi:hypothetical protein